MNIQQLKEAVDLAFERGINPETTVVIAVDNNLVAGGYYHVTDICAPTVPDECEYLWFTLNASPYEADSRFDEGHTTT